MSDTDEQEDAAPRRSHPMLNPRKRWTIGIWVFLFNFILALLAIYTVLSLTETPLGAPKWVTRQIEQSANAALPSGIISIGQTGLQVNDAGLPSVRLSNVAIFDERAVEVARLNNASVRLSALDALRGDLRPRAIDLAGAQITLRRLRDGTFDLSFGAGASASGSVPDLLDGFDAVFEQPFLADVRDITASDLTIALEDARSGRIWQITDGRLVARRLATGLDISVNFDVFNGTEDLAQVQLGLATNRDDARASLQARFVDAAARDIAVQSPVLSFLGVLDAPISGALRTEFTADGQLGDVNGTLEIGRGALQPNAAATPLPFDAARAYFDYDPAAQKIAFRELSVDAPDLKTTATGHAYLQDFETGWPSTLVAQFQFGASEWRADSEMAEPVAAEGGAVDLRLRLDPFVVDIGQVAISLKDAQVAASGRVEADEAGWHVAADASLDHITVQQLLGVWPQGVMAPTRLWIAQNVEEGSFRNLRMALRTQAGERPLLDLGFGFEDAVLRIMKNYPLAEGASGYGAFSGGAATFVLEEGGITAPEGEVVDLAGTSFRIPDLQQRPMQAEVSVAATGRAEDVVGLLALPPINALATGNLAPDFMSGATDLTAFVTYPMTPDRKPEDLRYEAAATITDAHSDVLIPDRPLDMRTVQIAARNGFVSATGPFRIGQVTGTGTWQLPATEEGGPGSVVTGTLTLGQNFIDEFGLGLPDGLISGQAPGAFSVSLLPDAAPVFTLESELVGMGLAVPQITWSKPSQQSGRLRVEGRLGADAEVTGLELSAPGLSLADGQVTLRDDGSLDRASFANVRAGDWYRGRISFEGRGPGLAPRLVVRGERLDLDGANFGSGPAESGGGPAEIALQRLQITDTIALTDVAAALDLSSGVTGSFNARLNGGARVEGRLESVRNGVAVRMNSTEGGEVIRDAGIFPSAQGGAFDLVMQPLASGGLYRGQMTLKNTNVQRAPVLTELLSALSIFGLLDQMRGAGIVFTDVAADFTVRQGGVQVHSSSAVGPSMGISLDGAYNSDSDTLDLQGVLSPVYFLNALGRIVSNREGEGLIGFNFTLTGPSDSPNVRVNPLSVLTPGFLRDIFRKENIGGR